MGNDHAINGKIHYFDWAIFNSYVKLPEGNMVILWEVDGACEKSIDDRG